MSQEKNVVTRLGPVMGESLSGVRVSTLNRDACTLKFVWPFTAACEPELRVTIALVTRAEGV
jgi:hypothetical protein